MAGLAPEDISHVRMLLKPLEAQEHSIYCMSYTKGIPMQRSAASAASACSTWEHHHATARLGSSHGNIVHRNTV